jgi:hypothetical protein
MPEFIVVVPDFERGDAPTRLVPHLVPFKNQPGCKPKAGNYENFSGSVRSSVSSSRLTCGINRWFFEIPTKRLERQESDTSFGAGYLAPAL